MKIRTTIDGVEYVVVVKSYRPGTPGYTWGRPEDCYPPESPEADFDLIDEMTGKPADDVACRHYSHIVDLIDDEARRWAYDEEVAARIYADEMERAYNDDWEGV